ncbi:SusC/RagA family TonB-linked outer membrane protein [Spirosoma endbachense]|uniref:SusC/RagA family TonB-linked outer membrane protein n=1 Tax=Spirosoma endbachense TaxID=2666025 RepID=A0A6P1W3F8_9BACT|nr:TonB-dependent receptor [Spirosoma endbachense]QHV99424.1 SusC/RagA family TonB-linked outer membrane protein [Spirosoma endbachense]
MKKLVRLLLLSWLLAGCLGVICQAQTLARAERLSQTGLTGQVAYRSLRQALTEVKNQYKVNILYESRTLDPFSLPESRMRFAGPLESVLTDLLSPFGLSFKRMKTGGYVVTTGAPNTPSPAATLPGKPAEILPAQLLTPISTPKEKSIQGVVQDGSNGQSLPGVSITLKGTQQGTSTDANGRYRIQVPDDNGVLVFSFIGFETREILIGNQADLNVSLTPSNQVLNEVVVVGYGTKRKRDLTGAISSVSSTDLQKVATSNFTSAIEGKVPGVYVTQTSGAPGSASSVRIRGVGTTGANQPLYVIDGVPMTGESTSVPGSSNAIDAMSILNPNDIESIEVLKDAASSAIYGSRGANGVILVTTKRGKEGAAVVSLNASAGSAQLWRKPAFLNAEEFATMANELATNSGIKPNPEWANPKSFGVGTDMVGLIFRNAPVQNYDLSISGGTKTLKARLSLGYNDQTGTMIETYYKRYTARVTADLKASDKLNFGGSLAFASTETKGQNSDPLQGGIFNLAQQFFPTLAQDAPFFGDGVYYTSNGDNPLLKAKAIDNKLFGTRIYGSTFGEIEILKGLKFKTSVGIDANFNRTRSWEGKIQRGFYVHPRATLSEGFDNRFNWLIENTLSYSKQIGDHSFSAVLGQSAQNNRINQIASTGNGFLSEELQVINASDVSLRTTSGTTSNARLASYFGRIDYAFKDKYLISASMRRDGSSNFGPNSKWGYFPAISGGWRISQEAFMAPLTNTVINDLKFRASWGRVGNDAIPAFGYLSTIRTGNSADNYALGTGDQAIIIGSSLVRPGNADLKWETTQQLDIGVDASLFGDKLYLTADYYKKDNIGMLISLPVSLEAGFQNPPTINGGQVRNTGIELLLGYRSKVGDLRYNVSANATTLKNEVISLGVGQPIVGPTLAGSSMVMTYTKVGDPIGYYRGYIVDGIYQTAQEINKTFQPNAIAGDFKYRDVNGDGALTDADKVNLGKPWPTLTYGFNVDLSYKGFDFNILLQGITGSQLYHANKITNYQMKYYNGNGIVNGVKDILNHWTPGSGINNQPGLKYTDANGNYSNASSFFVENGDYMRVRNVVLGYNLSPDLIRKVTHNAVKSLRVYVTAQNLFTFTKYSGFDPEVGSANPLNSGIDTGVYPQPRTLMGGINLVF